MAALLGENSVQYNSTTPHASGPALMVTTCRPTSCACSHIWVLLRCFPWPALIFSKSPKVMGAITPVHQGWIDIERPFAALALSVPEAADVRQSIRSDGTQNATGVSSYFGWPDSTWEFLL